MTSSFRHELIGILVGGLLVGCQPDVPSPDASDVPMRSIEHAMGTTQIPVSPQRVVVLDSAPLANAFALDIIPIGRPESADAPFYPEDNKTITSIGIGRQPNLETVLSLRPDLILGSMVTEEGFYQNLSRIAPTVYTEDNGRYGHWQKHFLLHADALGQVEKASELLAAYQQRVDMLKSKLSPSPQTLTASVIFNWPGGTSAYTTSSFPGAVLQDLGFKRNPAQDTSENYAIHPSKEELAAIDGDIIFLAYNSRNEGSIAKAEFVSNPLWSTLNAVERGIVCEVSSAIWAGGRSILAANQILTDVEACLASEIEATETGE
ncbi:MAG: iron-siderophore ABC transporter substrate-binding protein [Cyanobacteria bacterium P01_D01_bin.71]